MKNAVIKNRIMIKPAIAILLFSFFQNTVTDCSKDNTDHPEKPNPYAKTYYVATNGDDNGQGTFYSPWATWQKAFVWAKAGDTVYIRGGIYYVTDEVGGCDLTTSGTQENYINIFNYPGETPVLDGINYTLEWGAHNRTLISILCQD